MLTGFPAEGGSSSGSAVVPYTFTNRDVMLYALGGWSTEFVLSCSYMSLHSCTLYSAMYNSKYTSNSVLIPLGHRSMHPCNSQHIQMHVWISACTVHMPFTNFISQNVLYVTICAVGAEVSQTNTSELKFLFEGHEDFSTIPSYAVLPAMVDTPLICTGELH